MPALRSQFNWSQYRLLIQIDNTDKREYYELEALNNNGTGRELERLPEENPTIGILLCADENNEMVKYTLPEGNKTILASQYQLYLPSEKQLLLELKRELENVVKIGNTAQK